MHCQDLGDFWRDHHDFRCHLGSCIRVLGHVPNQFDCVDGSWMLHHNVCHVVGEPHAFSFHPCQFSKVFRHVGTAGSRGCCLLESDVPAAVRTTDDTTRGGSL